MTSPAYQLPTLTQLLSATPVERKQAFLDWLRSQDGATTYLPMSVGDCALARFNKAVNGERAYGAGGMTIRVEGVVPIVIVPMPPLYGYLCTSMANDYPPTRTYAELIAALEAHTPAL